MSGAIRVTPSASGQGWTLAIAPAWGRTGSGSDRLWCAHSTHALAATPSSVDRELQLRNAAERGDVTAIDALVDAGVDPNASNSAMPHCTTPPGGCAQAPSRHFSPLAPARMLATPTGPAPSRLLSGKAIAKQPRSLAIRAPDQCLSQPVSAPTRPCVAAFRDTRRRLAALATTLLDALLDENGPRPVRSGAPIPAIGT